ncbi:hypothetical protein AB0F77_37840 [Streptomyces sp. NPDC026672]|uniref:hypothetical protein n=1 Tax=unclassified Streptomyces TaxID=2593676 RepID=UPI0033CCD008
MRNRLGTRLSGPEEEVVVVYEALCRLVENHSGELAPYQKRNVLKALACLWQVMNGLDMEPRHLDHVVL